MALDPIVLVSSAGFVGAGIAIGGQTVIKVPIPIDVWAQLDETMIAW
ncbi:MAG: hypothetical protein ACFCVK_02595 [Acidimicrobiales bacterium]